MTQSVMQRCGERTGIFNRSAATLHEIDAKRGYKQAFVEQGSLASRTKAADRMRAVHWTLPEQK